MAKSDNTESEPLTEEQRITALEERVGTNKIVLLVIALILIVVISVSITVITISAMSDDEVGVQPESITELQQQVSDLSNENKVLTEQVKSLKKILPVIQDQLGNTSNLKLLSVVMEQERGNQEFLDTLRTGMYDLAHMLPGSRTWLEVYGEKVDYAEAHSKKREADLKRILKQSESNEEDDLW